MERGVTLSLDKGGLARVVSAPKEANTRYIRPILRRLLPFPSSSYFFLSLSLSFVSLLSLNPTNAHAAFIPNRRFCLLVVVASGREWGLLLDGKVQQVDDGNTDGEELYEWNRIARSKRKVETIGRCFESFGGTTIFPIRYTEIFTDRCNVQTRNLKYLESRK